jgi:hypothetical protein
VELGETGLGDPSLDRVPKRRETLGLEGKVEILGERSLRRISSSTFDRGGRGIELDVEGAGWKMLDCRRGIDLSNRGEEDPIRPGLILLLCDHPVIPGHIVETGKEKVEFRLREAGETPKGEVGDLVDWPTASSQPTTGGVIPANRDGIDMERALQIAHRGTTHLPLETLPSDCQARGKTAGTVDIKPDFEALRIRDGIRLDIKTDGRIGVETAIYKASVDFPPLLNGEESIPVDTVLGDSWLRENIRADPLTDRGE